VIFTKLQKKKNISGVTLIYVGKNYVKAIPDEISKTWLVVTNIPAIKSYHFFLSLIDTVLHSTKFFMPSPL